MPASSAHGQSVSTQQCAPCLDLGLHASPAQAYLFVCMHVCSCVQVIEKAYKKLRLDAMVIQQGRLVDNAKDKVDSMFNM